MFKKQLIESLFNTSTVLKNRSSQIALFISWMPEKMKGMELLFRASRDGGLADDFHARCDDKGPTLVLI